MRVFLTGATGLIGTGIARAVLDRGHDVVGLARSPTTVDRLRRAGVEPLSGDLQDPESLQRGVAVSDAVIHAGFPRNAYGALDEAIKIDQEATGVLLGALAGSSKPFIYTSGIGVVGDTGLGVVDEDSPIHTPAGMAWRRETELHVIASDGGVVIRPAFVYGQGGGEILQTLIRLAVTRGASLYPGDGANAWPNVHVDDLGTVFALALERAPAGTVLNVAAGEGTLRSVSEAIGRLIGEPEHTSSISLDRAREANFPFAEWIGSTSIRIDSTRTRELLDWHPSGLDIESDIEFGSYRPLAAHA